MRTTIDIPEDLMEQARRGAGLRTKQETVTRALHELIQRNAFEGLRRLAGKVDLDVDIAVARGRNKRAKR
jgi:Arc/MetJ family transcription regulator